MIFPNIFPTVYPSTPLGRTIKRVVDVAKKNTVLGGTGIIVNTSNEGKSITVTSPIRYTPSAFLIYKREWDADEGYNVNHLVRVLPDKEYKDVTGKVVKVTPGIWICVRAVPNLKVSIKLKQLGMSSTINERVDGINYNPTWPEPEPNYRFWELFCPLNICNV